MKPNELNQGLASDEKCFMPQREKYWSELSIEEKIERTREQVRNMQARNQRLEEEVERLRRAVPLHRHGVDGSVLLPMLDVSVSAGYIRGERHNRDEEYF